MVFFKKKFPLVLAFVMGVIMFVQFFVPSYKSHMLLKGVNDWIIIIGAFALVLGVGSLIRRHTAQIKRKSKDAFFSYVTLISLFITAFVGVFGGVQQYTVLDWIYNNVQVPLDATMFSLLAFFVASAAYRAFRARNLGAILLLVSAAIVMLGRVPVGDFISPYLPKFALWILNIPNMAAQRGMMIGIALGVVATSVKIILGIERAYLGEEED